MARNPTPFVERAAFGLLRVLSLLVLGFLALPVLGVIPLSFSSNSILTYPMPGLSLEWYGKVFTLEVWRTAIANSLYIAAWTVSLSVTIGTLAALGLARCGPPPRTGRRAKRASTARSLPRPADQALLCRRQALDAAPTAGFAQDCRPAAGPPLCWQAARFCPTREKPERGRVARTASSRADVALRWRP